MTILSRYLIKEFIKSSAAVFLVLLVLMMGNTLVKLLTQSADGELASQFVWPLMLLYLANYIVVLLGLSSFFGILMAFGRLYKDIEMSAMVACGVGPLDFLKPLSKFVFGVASICFVLSVFVLPYLAKVQVQMQSQSETPSLQTHLRAGEFNKIPGGVIFLESFEQDELKNAFIYRQDKIDGVSIQTAASGQIQTTDNGYELTLNQGELQQQHLDGRFTQIEFERYQVNITAPPLPVNQNIIEARSTMELMRSSKNQFVAEWQWRISLPIAVLLLSFVAFPLSYTSPRKGMFSRMGYAVLVFVLYNYSLSLAKALMIDGKVPQWLGLWWVHLPVLILFVVLMVKYYGHPRYWGRKFLA